MRPSAIEQLENRALLSVFAVNVADDTSDGLCDAMHCSLREAIEAANVSLGPDVVTFAIPDAGVPTIRPAGALPEITDAITIDGTTQPAGFVELDGSFAGTDSDGVAILSGTSVIRGLVVNRFSAAGVRLAAAGGNRIEGCRIGTDVTGLEFADGIGNRFGNGTGIIIEGPNNTIGGRAESSRNVISGNRKDGVLIIGAAATGNVIEGNFVGTDATGARALANDEVGVALNGGAQHNTIGGSAGGARNILSGNGEQGVEIIDAFTANNVVMGNYIGTDSTGTIAVPNQIGGVVIADSAFGNQVGANSLGVPNAAEGNLISGNVGDGIWIFQSSDNRIAGNLIGTDATGRAALANTQHGVLLFAGAVRNLIGGTTPAARNVLSGNADSGVAILDAATTENRVFGNFIGTDHTGTAALGNSHYGVAVFRGAIRNRIGTDANGFMDAEERNVISGNGFAGVGIIGSATSFNAVAGNFIGTDLTGSAAIANLNRGVDIFGGASANLIGTPGPASLVTGNLISGNMWDGVGISGVGSNDNIVAGNFIGTSATGSSAIGNVLHGVSIFGGAQNNTIGVGSAAEGSPVSVNVISGNALNGVHVSQAGTQDNVVAGNFIGLDATGLIAIGNGQNGVAIFDGAAFNKIGINGISRAAQRNVISANGASGVLISGPSTRANSVTGNFIGTTPDGMSARGNAIDGIQIAFAPNNFIGSGFSLIPDVVSGNGRHGVAIIGPAAFRNEVRAALIGTDVTGRAALGNQGSGIMIDGASENTIGVQRSVIAGNGQDGITITNGGGRNVVTHNSIGVEATGAAALANARHGVNLENAFGNTIGSTNFGEGNVISGNGQSGITVSARHGLFRLFDDAIGWWRAEGDTDDSLFGHRGVLRNGTGFSPVGRVGQGFRLDGVDDFVDLGTAASLAGRGAFSVEAWIRTVDLEGTIIQQRQADSGGVSGFDGEYVLSVGNVLGAGGEGRVCWVTFGDGEFGFQFCSERFVSDAIYHHVVGVRESDGTGRLYIDGVLDSEQAAPPRTLNAALAVAVGGDPRDNLHFLDGEIDEVVIHSRAIGGDEVGTDVTGTLAIGNAGAGVLVQGGGGNLIGGVESSAGNTIAFNGRGGVHVHSSEEAIRGNSIFGNNGLGIELGLDGVTPNDRGDADDGANRLQNCPVLTSLARNRGQVTLRGTLASRPLTPFQIELFDSRDADPTGHGEGGMFLFAFPVATNRKGVAKFRVGLAASLRADAFVTATATDPNQNTSEFSRGIRFSQRGRQAVVPIPAVESIRTAALSRDLGPPRHDSDSARLSARLVDEFLHDRHRAFAGGKQTGRWQTQH
jgi:titin